MTMRGDYLVETFSLPENKSHAAEHRTLTDFISTPKKTNKQTNENQLVKHN